MAYPYCKCNEMHSKDDCHPIKADQMVLDSDYPYYYYPPEHHITFLNSTFPEHHGPLHDTRHKVGQALHDLWKDAWPQPRADVRETLKNFYIDVEVPGIGSEDEIQLRWTNSRTLYAQFELKARSLPEEEEALAQQKTAAEELQLKSAAGEESSGQVGELADKTKSEGDVPVAAAKPKKEAPHHLAHSLVKERQLGKLKRAFYFYVDIDRESMTAHLRNGVLEITVNKNDGAHEGQQHEVKVQPHPFVYT